MSAVNSTLESMIGVCSNRCEMVLPSAQPGSETVDIQKLIATAMTNPIDFPTLDQSLIDSDQIAIVPIGVPRQFDQLLLNAVNQLPAFVSPEQITIALTSQQMAMLDQMKSSVAIEELWSRAHIKRFDPEISDQCAYLGPNAQNEPISVNRRLFDADMVIPLIAIDRGNINPMIALALAVADRQLSRSIKSLARDRKKQVAAAREVFNSLGICFAISAHISPGGSVHEIVAGEWKSVMSAGKDFVKSNWVAQANGSHDAIVGTIEIGVASEWREDLLNALDRLHRYDHRATLLIAMSTHDDLGVNSTQAVISEDELLATDDLERMVKITSHQNCYCLTSEDSTETMEKLGFTAIEDHDQLAAIMNGFRNPALIRDVHRAKIRSQAD